MGNIVAIGDDIGSAGALVVWVGLVTGKMTHMFHYVSRDREAIFKYEK